MKINILTILLLSFLLSSIKLYSQKLNNEHNENVTIYNIGKKYYNEKQYQLAIKEFDKIIQNNPYFFNAYFKKSYSYYNLKKYDLALKEIENAYEATNIDHKYFYMKAQFYDKMKKYQLAEYYLDMALELDRNNSYYYNYRGGLHLEMGKYKSALYDYDMLLSIKPEMYSAYYNRGMAKYNLKMKKEACVDWYHAYNESESCKRYFFYKCTKENLDGVKMKSEKFKKINNPSFSSLYDGRFEFYIAENIQYPIKSIANNEEGMVLLKFNLNKELNITNIAVIHSVSTSLDSVAIQIVKESKNYWIKPALIEGKASDIEILVPITFEIESGENNEKYRIDSLNQYILNKQYENVIQLSSEILKRNPFLYEVFLKRQASYNALNIIDTVYSKKWYSNLRRFGGVFYNQTRSFDKSVKLFYNKIWELSNKENAAFVRIGNWNSNDNFIKGEFVDYLITGEIHSRGFYWERGRHGNFEFYFKNGKVKQKLHFDHHNNIGKWTTYYSNGTLCNSFNVNSFYFSNMEMYDSTGVPTMNEGNGSFKYVYLDYTGKDTIKVTGAYKKYKKNGFWKFYIDEHLIAFDEYKNDKFTQGLFIEGEKKTHVAQPMIGSWIFIPNELTRSEKSFQDESIDSDYFMFLFRDKEGHLKGIY